MSFAAAWWLAALPFGAIWIILLHTRRKTRQEVGSVLLWRRVASRSTRRAPSRTPVMNVLLLLQVVALSLIVVALARPQLGASPRLDHLVLVVDASIAMLAGDENGSRLDIAKSRIVETYGGAGRDNGPRRVTLLVVTGEPYLLATRRPISTSWVDSVDTIRASAGEASWHRAHDLIRASVRANERTAVEVYSVDPEPARAAERTLGLPVDWHRLPPIGVNVSVRDVSIDTDHDDGRWRVRGTVGRHGDAPDEIVVGATFLAEGAQRPDDRAETTVSLASTDEADFVLVIDAVGAGTLTIGWHGSDALPVDDEVQFVTYGSPRSLRVLHVGAESADLRRAFESVGHAEVTVASALPDDANAYDLVVVERLDVDRHPGTSTLWIGSPPVDDAGATGWLSDPDPTGWTSEHPLSAGLDWQPLRVGRALDVDRLPLSVTLLEATGSPLIQARSTVAGREVFIAFDIESTNWAEQAAFPTFVGRLAEWIEPDLGRVVGAQCIVARPCDVVPHLLSTESVVVGPDGRPVDVPRMVEEGAYAYEPWLTPASSGVYTVTSGGPAHRFAVHAGDPTSTSPTPFGMMDGSGVRPELPSDPGATHLAFWALGLALVVLVGEAWLAGRRETGFLRRGVVLGPGALARRHRWSLTLRVFNIAAIGLALFQAPVVVPVLRSSAVLVIDTPSLWTERSRAWATDRLADAVASAGWLRDVGLVTLSDGVAVEVDVGAPVGDADVAIEPGGMSGDLASALRTAAGMLPKSGARSIVLVSDGNVAKGSVAPALQELAVDGVRVDVVPVGGIPDDEVLVEAVVAPARIHAGDAFLVEAIVFSERATEASVTFHRDGAEHSTYEVRLRPGRNRLAMTTTEVDPGRYLYEVEVRTSTRPIVENDRDGRIVTVKESPSVAIFAAQLRWGDALAEVLAVQGIDATVFPSDRVPYYIGHEHENIRGWLDYDVAVLMNVPAIDLTVAQQDVLATWVSDYGGGLIVMGGENTFGPGGYYDTRLEEIMPLSTKIPDDLPSVAMSFVLDRSGSMRQAVGDVTRLDVAKRATVEATALVDDESLVGVVVFDSEARELVEMQRAGDQDRLEAALEPLRPGGGTSIFPGLALGFEQLEHVDPERTRHIVVMTDGLSQPGDFERLLSEIVDAGITVSTAAIGRGADARLLANLARWGGGAAHVTEDFASFPSILAQEALMLSDEPVRVETFAPTWGQRDASFLVGLPDRLPVMHGYVMASAKDRADVHIYGPDDAPLLGSWRYGLGRVAAFASHAVGPWARTWSTMDAFPLFWSQVLRWAQPSTLGPGVHVEIRRSGEVAVIDVEAVAADGSPRLDAGFDAHVRMGEDITTLPLERVADGRYRATYDMAQTGRIDVVVLDSAHPSGADVDSGGGALGAIDFAEPDASLHVGYPVRMMLTREQSDRLSVAARSATGGRTLLEGDRSFVDRPTLVWARPSVLPWWTALAGLLLLSDLQVRYGLRRRGGSSPYRRQHNA